MKKAIKIFFGIIGFLLLILILAPVLFQDKIVSVIKEKINENVNAQVEFKKANLSLIRNFPNASVKITDILVTNFEPFKGDTLFYANEINLKLSLFGVIKGNEINIKSFGVYDAKVNIITNKDGKANYDIAKKTAEKPLETEKDLAGKKGKILAIKSYAITNSQISYTDKKGKITAQLKDFNHSGAGDFSADRTELDSKTATNVLLKMNGKTYADNLYLSLNALLDLDLKNQKFTFLKNEAHINRLPLLFNGYVKINKNSQEIDLSFKTPSSDFKNFLALVPKEYAKNISDVKTTGNFDIKGKVNGIIDDKHIPKIDININSNDASFKYPNLPKSVNNIQIIANINNNTGIVEHTTVSLNNLSFKIDDNNFRGKAKVNRLTTNPLVDATIKGKLNLAHIDKVYPLDMKNKLSGVINADLNTQFDAEAIKKSIPERIKNNGKISINDFEYNSKEIANPIAIKNAEINFEPSKISLTNFDAKTGSTDLKANGTIQNLLGFLLSDKKLEGTFALNSNEFRIDDFMQKKEEKEEKKAKEDKITEKGKLKIPAFLDIVTQVNVKKVFYDNLELQNVIGILIIKDERAVLKEVNANMFDGEITLKGTANTKPEVPTFNMKMNIKDFDISKSFEKLEMFKLLAPIASVVQGKINTNIGLQGNLKDDFTPNLNTIAGDAFAQMLTKKLNPSNSKTMSLLNNKLSFIDLKKLNLDNLKTSLTFKGGKVNVKPFNLKYKDIDMSIGGSHGFDQSMDYKLTLDVPAKYLGTQANNLLAKLDNKNKNTKVPVTANLTGSFTNPSVSTDMSSAVTNFTGKLIEQQKNKLIGNTLDKVLGGSKKANNDSTQTKEVIKDKMNNVIDKLFGK